MTKIFFLITVIALSACSNSTETSKSDSLDCDTTCIDSINCDSTKLPVVDTTNKTK